MAYYSLDNAYGMASLKNTPSEYSNMQRPCLTGYPEDPIHLFEPIQPAETSQVWDNNYLDASQAYTFPKKSEYE
jgi:hypothetical protein